MFEGKRVFFNLFIGTKHVLEILSSNVPRRHIMTTCINNSVIIFLYIKIKQNHNIFPKVHVGLVIAITIAFALLLFSWQCQYGTKIKIIMCQK